VSDKLPSQVDFEVSDPVPSSIIGNTLSWNFISIENSKSETIEVTVKVKENVKDGVTITNIATVESETEDPDDENNESTEVETEVITNGTNDPHLVLITKHEKQFW
jgi:hypothetical protein